MSVLGLELSVVAFEGGCILSSLKWIVSARICEVYVNELGKSTPTYIETVRGSMLNEKVHVDGADVSLFSGDCSLKQVIRCSGVRIRCLSIKEKTHLSVRSVVCFGTLLSIKLPEVEKSMQERYPERIIVPKPIKWLLGCVVMCRPEDSLSSSLQTAFAQQVLFEGKMNSLEERLGLKMERLITTLTVSFKTQNEEMQKRMNVSVWLSSQVADDGGHRCNISGQGEIVGGRDRGAEEGWRIIVEMGLLEEARYLSDSKTSLGTRSITSGWQS